MLSFETPSQSICFYICDDSSLGKYPFNKYYGNDQQDFILEYV